LHHTPLRKSISFFRAKSKSSLWIYGKFYDKV